MYACAWKPKFTICCLSSECCLLRVFSLTGIWASTIWLGQPCSQPQRSACLPITKARIPPGYFYMAFWDGTQVRILTKAHILPTVPSLQPGRKLLIKHLLCAEFSGVSKTARRNVRYFSHLLRFGTEVLVSHFHPKVYRHNVVGEGILTHQWVRRNFRYWGWTQEPTHTRLQPQPWNIPSFYFVLFEIQL